jgi:putative protein-disulfide isomerase
MEPTVLHYIYDPLCGWCYGAAPLLQAAAEIDGMRIELHAGGMMTGAQRQPATALRDFVMIHDRRVEQLTGQPYSDAYREGLLRDPAAIFDSEPPITAILQAETLGAGRAMLDRIHRARFVEGRRICDRPVLEALAADLGVALTANVDTWQHIEESRRLLQEIGGSGFPTFAYRRENRWTILDTSRYLGKPEQWRAALTQALA